MSLYDHGYGPFELPIHGLLQEGQDNSLPKACFEEPSFLVGIQSAMNIQITKQIGTGAQWVELLIRGMDKWSTYRLLLLILVGHMGGLFLDGRRPVPKILSLDIWVCTTAIFSQ